MFARLVPRMSHASKMLECYKSYIDISEVRRVNLMMPMAVAALMNVADASLQAEPPNVGNLQLPQGSLE